MRGHVRPWPSPAPTKPLTVLTLGPRTNRGRPWPATTRPTKKFGFDLSWGAPPPRPPFQSASGLPENWPKTNRNNRFRLRSPSRWSRFELRFRFPARSGQTDPSQTRSSHFWPSEGSTPTPLGCKSVAWTIGLRPDGPWWDPWQTGRLCLEKRPPKLGRPCLEK